ncbi:hypothetical protein GQ44DRAFT_733940 [Phaeosphaeriaceae sp. PMI808]|nr:hypothetical protein GQ44DRAFT_733940 [Phaeosphaeriaceae sp. PMI808]
MNASSTKTPNPTSQVLATYAHSAGQTRKYPGFRSLADKVETSPSAPKLKGLAETVKWINYLGRLFAAYEDEWSGDSYSEKIQSWTGDLDLTDEYGVRKTVDGKTVPEIKTLKALMNKIVKTTGNKARVHFLLALLANDAAKLQFQHEKYSSKALSTLGLPASDNRDLKPESGPFSDSTITFSYRLAGGLQDGSRRVRAMVLALPHNSALDYGFGSSLCLRNLVPLSREYIGPESLRFINLENIYGEENEAFPWRRYVFITQLYMDNFKTGFTTQTSPIVDSECFEALERLLLISGAEVLTR